MSRHWLLASAALTFALLASSCSGGNSGDTLQAAPTASTSAQPSATAPSPAGSPSIASAQPSTAAPSPNGRPSSPAPSGITITTGASDYGTMLFDANKQAIYIWESEESSRPECYGGCATAWPPVLTTGAPTASGKVDAGLLGTTKRKDGSTQVTYNGHPLYFYAHEGPGEVKCHNVSTHGGLWWVVQPDGDRAP